MNSNNFQRFFTKPNVVNMNDYTHNILLSHWNELFKLKEQGNLDFFFIFSLKDHFYKVDVEKLNKPQICRILPNLFQNSANLRFI